MDQKDQRWSRQIPFLIDSSFRLVAQANLFTGCNFLKLFMLLKEDYLHKVLRSELFRGYNWHNMQLKGAFRKITKHFFVNFFIS